MSDTELIDRLDTYIRENGYLLIHNTNGSNDSRWPKGYNGTGLGLTPYNPRTLRQALICMFREPGAEYAD